MEYAINKKIISRVLFLGIILGMILLAVVLSQKSYGSVSVTDEYNATTTSATFLVAPDFKLIKSGQGTFGSLVVTTTGTGVINVYDATTTVNGGIYGTTTLASLTTSAAGTYTFDTVFIRGLVVETVGANTGTTTITYR